MEPMNPTPAVGTASTGQRCPKCCAPAGQPCAPGCSEAGLAGAVRKAIEMLAQVDVSKVPLAVPAAIGVLRSAVEAAPDSPCAAPQSEWTSAATLPDDETMVLVALANDEVWPAYRDADVWRYVDAMPIVSEQVTHWMPMPAGPRGAACNQNCNQGRVCVCKKNDGSAC